VAANGLPIPVWRGSIPRAPAAVNVAMAEGLSAHSGRREVDRSSGAVPVPDNGDLVQRQDRSPASCRYEFESRDLHHARVAWLRPAFGKGCYRIRFPARAPRRYVLGTATPCKGLGRVQFSMAALFAVATLAVSWASNPCRASSILAYRSDAADSDSDERGVPLRVCGCITRRPL
jgi:hypothetical protein